MEVYKLLIKLEDQFDIFYSNIGYGYPYLIRHNIPFITHFRASHRHLRNVHFKSTYFNIFSIENLKDFIYHQYYSFIEFYLAKKSDLLIFNSEETKKKFIQYNKIPIEKTHVIPNGVGIPVFPSIEKEFLKKKLNLSPKKILLFVGRLTYDKNIDRLIHLMKDLKIREDIVLLIIGDGELFEKIQEDIIRYELKEKILLLGAMKNDLIFSYYAVADLYIHPTTPGTTLIEAMASYTPFIVYRKFNDNSSGIPIEEIKKSNSGIFLEDCEFYHFSQKILEVIDDKNWLQFAGSNGGKFVREEMNWEKIAEKTQKHISLTINNFKKKNPKFQIHFDI